MGTLSSGIGLISGIDSATLIERLLAIDAQPRDLVQQRINKLDTQRTALLDVSARVNAILSRLGGLSSAATFRSRSVNSSQDDVLTASASTAAVPGTFAFIARQLSARQQLVSRGFQSANTQLSPGTLTIESARARVNNATHLAELNGMAGVQRGQFTITDGAGATRTIDARDATTLREIVDRINNAGLSVRAEVRDDRLSLTETSGRAIRIAEVEGGGTAASLGFAEGHTFSTTGALLGDSLMRLSASTGLSQLNDGNGVRRARAGGDFRFTDATHDFKVDLSGIVQDGTRLERLNQGAGVNLGRVRIVTKSDAGADVTREIDLTGKRTLGEIKSAIDTAAPDLNVTLTGSKLIVSYDSNGSGKTIRMEDITGTSVRDLGLDSPSSGGKITGRDVLKVETMADVVAAVNYADGNDGAVVASIGDKGLVLRTSGDFELSAVGDSKAITDLGLRPQKFTGTLSGARVIGGIDTVLLRSLNGGRGVELGTIKVAAGGQQVSVSLDGTETLADAVTRINDAARAQGAGVDLRIDPTGTRLLAQGSGGASISIEDVSGNFATVTGLRGDGANIRGQNLQRQYVSAAMKLSDLNDGRGVSGGRFTITAASGRSSTVDIPTNSKQSLGEIIDQINATNIGVIARINDTGDGLQLTDTSASTGSLKITDSNGTAARDLNIAGDYASRSVDGTYETRIDVTSTTTLQSLTDRINARGTSQVIANLLNDGSPVAPARLQLTAKNSGTSGEFLIDGLESVLGFSTLSRAQDAKVILGSNAETGVLLTSGSDTFRDVAPGVDLTLHGTSSDPVTVTVAQKIDDATSAIDGLVTALNGAFDRIQQLSDYDTNRQEGGPLFGDSTTQTIESRLIKLVSQRVPGASGSVTSLSQLGVKLSNGDLSFDKTKFEEVFRRDPEGVIDFLTRAETGYGAVLKKGLEALTGSDGVIKRRDSAYDKERTDLSNRVTQITELISRKRDRLTRQFQAMESSLAALQSQQNALSAIFGASTASTSTRR